MVATLLQICSSRELESNLSHPNRIIKLPGQPQVSFQQFSGYVTVDDRKHRALFYYFAEAEMDPSSKPLLGNPVLEFSTDFNSRAEFFWSHGLISDSTYRIFTSACNYSRYVGGWTQVYGDVLAFATVRGASHEAPFSQPERSLVLFRAFLQGRPLPETFTYAP
ncbi:hypothetical protein BHE74_00053105 [Ensete ventricosum]|nr:hypothetical protein BHE74_00053105 [Ensete ventricosum]